MSLSPELWELGEPLPAGGVGPAHTFTFVQASLCITAAPATSTRTCWTPCSVVRTQVTRVWGPGEAVGARGGVDGSRWVEGQGSRGAWQSRDLPPCLSCPPPPPRPHRPGTAAERPRARCGCRFASILPAGGAAGPGAGPWAGPAPAPPLPAPRAPRPASACLPRQPLPAPEPRWPLGLLRTRLSLT